MMASHNKSNILRNKFPNDLYEFLNSNTLIEIKGGTKRKTFLAIWMVTVGKRVFARTWGKSSNSWFTAFIEEGIGQIKYGDKKLNVTGKKIENDASLMNLIDKQYLNKYNQEENFIYVKGITQPEYADYTMEFFYN